MPVRRPAANRNEGSTPACAKSSAVISGDRKLRARSVQHEDDGTKRLMSDLRVAHIIRLTVRVSATLGSADVEKIKTGTTEKPLPLH